jgi:hypothetical protein
MSNSSLSLPPMSEPSLPILPPAPPSPQPLQLRRTASQLRLPKSDSPLFTAGLFCRTLLETMPPTVQLRCMQLGCKYSPKPQPLDHSITSNYWTHYKNVHPEIAMLYNQNAPQSLSSRSSLQQGNAASFFTQLLKTKESTAEVLSTKLARNMSSQLLHK